MFPDIEQMKEKSNLNEFLGVIRNQTILYFESIEGKIVNYQDYLSALNCDDCTEKIFGIVESFKKNFNENINLTKNMIMKMSKDFLHNIENMNLLKNFLDSLTNFKKELLQKIDSREMEWMDIWHKSHLDKQSHFKVSKLPIFGMIFGAIFCLICSTVYHLFSCHCEQTNNILNRIDYAGISILIAGSCYPPYFYFFYCSSFFSMFYVTFITIFAVVVFACSLKSDFNTPKRRSLRGILFSLLGVSTAAPFIHILFFSQYTPGIITNPQLSNWVIGGISYLFGAVIYIWRFPEKYWPGKFDFGGNSHNIFHIMVIIGVIFHYLASLDSYHDRLNQVCY